MAVLAGLRGRPWLFGCLGMMAGGAWLVVMSRFGYLIFRAGILAITGGLLVAVGAETGYRRARSGPPPDTHG
jgi:hypothetical protein